MVTENQQYKDDHAGENPRESWPPDEIGFRFSRGLDKLKEEIGDCRGCSEEHGLCDRHDGMTDGYLKARQDVWREIRNVGLIEEFNKRVENNEYEA